MISEFTSLSEVLDIIADVAFYKKQIPLGSKKTFANWIVSRQGKGYPYGNLYGITDKEKSKGLRLFTGEKLIYGAKARHVLGEEALRALKLLNVKDKNIIDSFNSASEWMENRLLNNNHIGFYCCKGCTPSVWRAIGANVYSKIDDEAWIIKGISRLKQSRLGNGKWKSYPYHYTILALAEFDFKEVFNEMRYTIPVLEKIVNSKTSSIYQKRRIDLAERILNKFS